MLLRKERRAFISLVAVGLFVFSMISMGNAAVLPSSSQDSSISYTYSQALPAQSGPESGTWVNWQQESNTTSDEWTWESKNWLFGPSPSFEIFHENGSLLTSDSWAEIDETITFVVTVPKDILQGVSIGSVRFNGWYQTADWNYSAGFDFSFEDWEWTFEPWNAWSYQWNSSDVEGGPPEPSFVDIIPEDCSNTTDTNNYYFTFAVRFNEYAPLGLYQINMDIEDREHNWIGSYNFGSGYQFQGIAVGMDPDDAWTWSYGGSYTLQKLDTEGDQLYSVSRLTDFVMRYNITGANPQWAMLSFNMPGGMQVPVNRTGWHQELQTNYGGWVYNETLETYVWDPNVEVTTMVEVYGQYESYEWTDIGGYEEINVTYLYEEWNDITMTWEKTLVEQTQWVEKKNFYIYNFTSEAFEQYFGYTYWGYPYETIQPDTWNEEITVFEPIPEDYPIFYELNVSECSTQTVGNEIVVDFVGYFTELMPKTDQYSYFRFDTRVMGPDHEFHPDTWGDDSRQTHQEFELARSITIETPVTIAKILDPDGTQPRGWMFQVNPGEEMLVKGRLQGGNDIAEDIDGLSFYMEAYDSYWSEEYSRWSNLQYVIDIATDGTETMKAFNMTQKFNYTYGTYMDYILKNKTGWYYEYNETTNSWNWVYGEYQEWEWGEVEGWHWQDWYYNQLTQEWQKEWIEYRSAETVVPANFGTVSSYTNWTSGGDYFASFLFSPGSTMPETNYWWDFAFMNNTWYEDYSSGWGEHEVEDWGLEWVHSFDYQGQKVYVEEWNDNQLAYDFVNGTLIGEIAYGLETPFITIDGEDYPIKVRENYDPWSGNVWKNMFFYEYWDPETGTDIYSYELANGTKVYVTYTETFTIYNVTTFTGDSFLTAQDYHRHFYDGVTEYVYWIDIDGVIHSGSYSDYGRYNLAYFGIHDHVERTPNQPWTGYLVYGSSLDTLHLIDFFWSSRDSCYYLTTEGGALIQLVYNEITYNYEIFIDGAWEVCSWPQRYYTEEYMGSDALLATYSVSRYWYTEVGGVEYEMPYPGAHAQWTWELDTTELDGGKVPTTKSLEWDGDTYRVREATLYDWVKIDGEVMEVHETTYQYVRANNTHIWNPEHNGFSGYVGTYDANLAFNKMEQITYNNVTNDPWPDYVYGDDAEYLYLNNGTTWVVNESYIFTVFEYDVDGKSLFSTQEWPAYYESGNASWYEYKAVNGTIYQFEDWYRPPVLDTLMVSTVYNGSGYSGHYFSFMGGEYEFKYEGRYQWTYKVDNATYTGDLFFFWDYGSSSVKPILEFDYEGELVEAIAHNQYVKRLRLRWGHALVYGLQKIESAVYKNFHDFVVGTPDWGMWGVQNWVINEDNGAIDLDGDLDTTEDQYYVQEEYQSKDSWTHEYDKMWVNIDWDPNTTLYGDNMHVWSWMGLDTYTWSYEWNQTFYWYNADDFSQLTSTEMQDVVDTLISPEGEPMPGYWDISWMAENVTWQDIIDDALENGWDWITSNEQSWTWLSFGISQNYGTSYEDAGVDHWLNIGMHYEYSGLMVWEDGNEDGLMNVDLTNPGSGELSHYLIPDSVDSIDFTTPGFAYGDYNESGFMLRDIEDEITWGVEFHDVNGTVFPYTTYGYWGWYDSFVSGSDLRTFDERPTQITIDELSFLVHFQGTLSEEEGALNNFAEIKVDNYVGNWDVDMTGGRDNLENRSLALNYLADVSMSDFAFKANGSFADGESTVASDVFEFETAGAQFAEMIMGGVTYDWGKNTTAPYDVVSMTTPVGTFRQAFESESGQSAVGWSSTSNMFYVTIGFPEWDGYDVMQDPVFVGYTSTTGTDAVATFSNFQMSTNSPQEGEMVTIQVDISSDLPLDEVYLEYSTDQASWDRSSMWNMYDNTYAGDIPGFDDGTTVYYRVAVVTAAGTMYSSIQQYTVGQTAGFEGLPFELLIMGVGVIVVLALIVVVLRRRR